MPCCLYGFCLEVFYLAVGQNLRHLFGDDCPPKVVYFKGFWDVHRGTGVLTHCHLNVFGFWIVLGACLHGFCLSEAKFPRTDLMAKRFASLLSRNEGLIFFWLKRLRVLAKRLVSSR